MYDTIAGWSQADLRRFVVNLLLSDPGALPPTKDAPPLLGSYLGRFTPSTWDTGVAGAKDMDMASLLADATNGVVWTFLYNPGSSSAFKWEFVSGSPLFAAIATDQTTVSATYADLATVGPSITVPRAGDYIIEMFSHWDCVTANGNVEISPKLGAAAAVDADGSRGLAPVVAAVEHLDRRLTPRTLAASDVVTLQYKTSAGTAHFFDRSLHIEPVRIS